MSPTVAIFWDYENCALPALEPSSYAIVNKIRRLALQYGSVKSFKAYLEYPEQPSPRSIALRSELQSCGVSLIDCPHNGRKDVADKMMMVDMMAHAIDTPAPSTIILISGDRDFVYAVSILSLRQYRVVLLAPKAAHSSLKAQAEVVHQWPEDFLPDPPQLDAAVLVQTPNQPPRPSTRNGFAPSNAGSVFMTPPSTISGSSVRLPDNVHTDEPTTGSTETASDPPPANISKYTPGTPRRSDLGLSSPYPGTWNPPRESEYGSPGLNATQGLSWVPRAEGPPRAASLTRPDTKDSSSPQIAGASSSSPQRNIRSSVDVFYSRTFPSTTESTDAIDADNRYRTGYVFSRAANSTATEAPVPVPAAPAPPARAPILAAFKPLVKVLRRRLAEGFAETESSQLGQFLSQEVAPLSVLYERAGVSRLKEYTALAAEQGVVTLTREGLDGHHYVALHPAFRRKAASGVGVGTGAARGA